MNKKRTVIFVVMIVGCGIGGVNTNGLTGLWAGPFLGLFLFVLVAFFFGWTDQQPEQQEETANFRTIENTGELVPARRGKPDPTRPN